MIEKCLGRLMMYKKYALSVLFSLVAISGCTALDEKEIEVNTTEIAAVGAEKVNDFPTRDRVEYVFNCIAKHGGKLEYVTQYACGCKIDKIAEKLTFAEYEAAFTFTTLRSTPGEKGGVFRDPKQSKSLRTRLKEAEAYAESQCFVS